MAEEIDEEILEELYTWIDDISLSRPKKDLRRDFSDGGKRSSQSLTLTRTLNLSLCLTHSHCQSQWSLR